MLKIFLESDHSNKFGRVCWCHFKGRTSMFAWFPGYLSSPAWYILGSSEESCLHHNGYQASSSWIPDSCSMTHSAVSGPRPRQVVLAYVRNLTVCVPMNEPASRIPPWFLSNFLPWLSALSFIPQFPLWWIAISKHKSNKHFSLSCFWTWCLP